MSLDIARVEHSELIIEAIRWHVEAFFNSHLMKFAFKIPI